MKKYTIKYIATITTKEECGKSSEKEYGSFFETVAETAEKAMDRFNEFVRVHSMNIKDIEAVYTEELA